MDLKRAIILLKPLQVKNRFARTAPIYGKPRGFLEMEATVRDQKWPNCPWGIA